MAGCFGWYPAATAATTATGQTPQGVERGDGVATGGDTGPLGSGLSPVVANVSPPGKPGQPWFVAGVAAVATHLGKRSASLPARDASRGKPPVRAGLETGNDSV